MAGEMKENRWSDRFVLLVTSVCFFLLTEFPLYAEMQVFENEVFPYRVVCETGWIETNSSDSLLVLDNTEPGKKTRLKLKRYTLGSTYSSEYMEWSLMNFAYSKEIAYSFGRLIFFDTTATKKLGGHHALELFAYYTDSSKTVWFAEYDRWTEHNGYGYLASIFGDTLDMKQNFPTYTAMIDSISFSYLTVPLFRNGVEMYPLPLLKNQTEMPLLWYDLLGREIAIIPRYHNHLLVGKKVRRCTVK